MLGTGAHIVGHPTHQTILTPHLIGEIIAERAAIVTTIKTDYCDVFGEEQSDDFQFICSGDSAGEGGPLAGCSNERIMPPQIELSSQ